MLGTGRTMNKITTIKSHKDKKVVSKITQDLTIILKVFRLAEQALEFYKHYDSVSKVLTVIKTQKALLEIHEQSQLERKKSSDT